MRGALQAGGGAAGGHPEVPEAPLRPRAALRHHTQRRVTEFRAAGPPRNDVRLTPGHPLPDQPLPRPSQGARSASSLRQPGPRDSAFLRVPDSARGTDAVPAAPGDADPPTRPAVGCAGRHTGGAATQRPEDIMACAWQVCGRPSTCYFWVLRQKERGGRTGTGKLRSETPQNTQVTNNRRRGSSPRSGPQTVGKHSTRSPAASPAPGQGTRSGGHLPIMVLERFH